MQADVSRVIGGATHTEGIVGGRKDGDVEVGRLQRGWEGRPGGQVVAERRACRHGMEERRRQEAAAAGRAAAWQRLTRHVQQGQDVGHGGQCRHLAQLADHRWRGVVLGNGRRCLQLALLRPGCRGSMLTLDVHPARSPPQTLPHPYKALSQQLRSLVRLRSSPCPPCAYRNTFYTVWELSIGPTAGMMV